MMNPQIENPKSTLDGFELPCGYLDADGNLHTYIEVVEMTGEEEEVLAARNMPVMKKLNRILSRCTTAIGSCRDPVQIERIVPLLTQGDRAFLLFAIRRVTLGDEFPFTTRCPKCEGESHLTIDLSDLEIKPMKDPKVRTYDIELPKSKKKVQMKVLDGVGEELIAKAATTGRDVISTAILARVAAVDGKPGSLSMLKSLPMMDRNYLRGVWQEHEGGVDTGLDVQCPSCDNEYEAEVDIGSPGFFNPSAVRKP